MKIIIISDIFGRTPEFEDIASELSSNFPHMTLIDPYESKPIEFKNESAAYTYFQQNVGIERYKSIVSEVVSQSGREIFLIGFSVGASAVWLLSGEMGIRNDIKAICFYGSQVRDFLHIDPQIEMELFFPRHEFHFNVENLIFELSPKNYVTCHITPYLHGFMNKKSYNFDEIGYHRYLQIIKEKIA